MLSDIEYNAFLDWFYWNKQAPGGSWVNPPPNTEALNNNVSYWQYQKEMGLSPAFTPATTTTQGTGLEQSAYQQYIANGGSYDFTTWKGLGMPTSPGGTETSTYTQPSGYPDTYTDAEGRVFKWNPYKATYDQVGYTKPETQKPPGLYNTREEALAAAGTSGYTPVQMSNGYWGLEAPSRTTPIDQASLDLQRQQLQWQQTYQQQQLEAEKQARLANLRANPASWLEYASMANQQPAIQPWMLPLMPQEYAGTVAGAPIPGWQAGAPTMAELPQLTNPGIQYQARMGPTALQQYYGYQQARTGATPTESQWRLWSQAPPSGSSKGLVWQR